MKGFLKSQEGIFQLAPKVTTVGREGCDLVIQVCLFAPIVLISHCGN